jgi:hypothetical protein
MGKEYGKSGEERIRKSAFLDGGGFYIRVNGCNNPVVNSEKYWGPLIYSLGLHDGIQNDPKVYLLPNQCPKEALESMPAGDFIQEDYSSEKDAICVNVKCPFNTGYKG